MRKNEKDLINRISFISLVLDNPEKAEKFMTDKFKELKKHPKTSKRVQILANMLFVSEQTIWKEYAKLL